MKSFSKVTDVIPKDEPPHDGTFLLALAISDLHIGWDEWDGIS